MAGLKLMTTGGYVPRVAPHLLNDNEAQRAINTKLYSGVLRSWKKPLPLDPVVSVPDETETIYKGKDTSGDAIWLSWITDVDVVQSPLESASPMSIYYTGDGVPKKTNSALAGTANGTNPDAWYKMGVPAPASAPTVTRVGTGSSPETRIYVYTYINEFGDVSEESAPSPVSAEVLCGSGDTVTVSGFATAPTANLNITKRRIYRSVSGSNATAFQFVTEIPLSTTSFSDDVASAGLGETLESLLWEEPPSNLAGLVALPNGFLAGFADETVYFSEVNRPHAWPSGYGISVGQKIVGLGVFGQSVVVMTKGYPYVISGLSPDGMTAEKMPILEPCVSKQSIVSDTSGVTYASPNGLVAVGPGQAGVVTSNVFLRDDFAKFGPLTIQGKFYGGKYFGFFNDGTGLIERGAFILDQTLAATPLSLTTIHATAAVVDIDNAEMFVVSENKICTWDTDTLNTLPYEWVSKRFIMNAPCNLSALEIDADFGNIEEGEALQARIEAIIASNQAIWAAGGGLGSTFNAMTFNARDLNGSILAIVPKLVDDRYLLVEVFCDGRKVHTSQYTKNGIYRMPSGFKGQSFEVRIAGNIELRYIKMAETVKELKTL